MLSVKSQLENNCFLITTTVFNQKIFAVNKASTLIQQTKADENEGTKARTLIDTGATSCCVTEELAEKLGLVKEGTTIMATAGHFHKSNLYSIVLEIPPSEKFPSSEDYFRTPELMVASMPKQNGDRGFDIVLGMDVLMETDFQYKRNAGGGGGVLTIDFEPELV